MHFSFLFLSHVSNFLLDRLTNNPILCAVKFVLLVCELSFILILGFCVLLGPPAASSQQLSLPLLVDVCHASVATLGSRPHSQICSQTSQSDSLPSDHTSMLHLCVVFAFPPGCKLVSQISQTHSWVFTDFALLTLLCLNLPYSFPVGALPVSIPPVGDAPMSGIGILLPWQALRHPLS